MKLKDQVALLTHCGNPLGQAIAFSLGEEGANLCLCELPGKSSALRETVQELEKIGKQAIEKELDITDKHQIQKAVEETFKHFGRLDILVNIVVGPATYHRFMENLPIADWDRAMAIMLRGAFFYSQAASKFMKDQKRGKIIYLSSRDGRTAAELTDFAEVTAQAGIFGFTRQLAHQLGPYGINVNAIAAGIVLPGWRWEKAWMDLDEENKNALLRQIPLRRFARPGEIGRVVVFLASDDASYITGATIDVNGGQLMPIFPPRSETLAEVSK
ncbi:MAG: SDR family oxidoreductase [Deltaproteobacteria bacterium]|nr:SDR family oxidoreductase [Deltaproteobacteria bacterium]